MGYTTEFEGSFKLNKKLKKAHAEYLSKFAETRRMKRNGCICETMEDPIRKKVKLPVGFEGEFFVGGVGYAGQDHDSSVKEGNSPPSNQPGLWCQWVPSEDLLSIEWDGNEKFYDYVGWIKYLIEKFLAPWGYVLNGEVTWRGEDDNDKGKIVIKNNEVSVLRAHLVYQEDLVYC